MGQEIVVLGAGMVGTATALELQSRGHRVTLVDRRAPGQETSYGNAGAIQREAVEPYAMPRDWRSLLSVVLKRGLDVNYHLRGLLAAWPQLLRYWQASAPEAHRRIGRQYATLIAHCTPEHERLMTLAGAHDLVRRDGLLMIYRSERALDAALRHSQRLSADYGTSFSALDAAGIAALEPAFRTPLAGAVHWRDSWRVSDPGSLVERYASAFTQRGGRVLIGDADSLRANGKSGVTAGGSPGAAAHSSSRSAPRGTSIGTPIGASNRSSSGAGWTVDTEEGPVQAGQVVLALGPWMGPFARRLGYRWPLFVKRGYHRHFTGGASLHHTTLDAERGYVMSPQRRGLRITSGAEIACLGAPLTPRQLDGATAEARGLLDLGQPVEAEPWMGGRPCCADMKPIIGAAPRHRGLWINCGHGHHGFSLGPASARLLADLIEGAPPYVDDAAFSPSRFGR
ncbi:MAG: FAD-dependent oxidoreductase [Mitsuaria chitosanitabida]|uniref:NAD(P)/FAD-dependent oxidoreductase n=1 Tax=Roseateles chitosanitabidus TaxID=65048 RepID=UPI001AFD04BC|nr:FAD-dependent oxidoreductase [Roseateles chitosanitabidus]MBO9688214.1 FAD-dependent oxidoreductase [Roseateles chitosanitabidus]